MNQTFREFQLRILFAVLVIVAVLSNVALWILVSLPFVVVNGKASPSNQWFHVGWLFIILWVFISGGLIVFMKRQASLKPANAKDLKFRFIVLTIWFSIVPHLIPVIYYAASVTEVDGQEKRALLATGVGITMLAWLCTLFTCRTIMREMVPNLEN